MPDELADEIEGARAYEDLHVNALFRQWAGPLLDAAGVAAGDTVLDVACGTGVVAREAAKRVGDAGSVTGLDIGAGMLAVAESIEPAVTWTEGDACDLPFETDQFDVVVSQFGLMFFADRARAITEMLRCVKPTGTVAVAVWDSLERSAAYPLSVDLLRRRAGDAAAEALRAPFVLGDVEVLRRLFERGGASSVSIETLNGTARFPSVRAMVEADLRGWLPVMGVPLNEELIEEILTEAEEVLEGYVADDGTMSFDAPAHVVTVRP